MQQIGRLGVLRSSQRFTGSRIIDLVRPWRACLLGLCLLLSSAIALSTEQDGFLNPRFGTNGLVKVAVPNAGGATLYAIDMQRDSMGRFWLLSDVPTTINSYRIGLNRVLPDGQLDTTFSGDGFAGPQLTPMAGETLQALTLAFSVDGKLLVAGQRRIPNALNTKGFVCRLTVSGALDASFGDQGCARPVLGVLDNTIEAAFTMRVLADGKILLIGATRTNLNQPTWRAGFVLRLLSNGQVDTSFGAGLGWVLVQPPDSVMTDLADALALPDGDLLVAGYSNNNGAFVQRLNDDGTIDGAWAAAGLRYLDVSDLHNLPIPRLIPTRLLLHSDQRVSLCARLDYDAGFNKTLIAAFRLDANGALDPNFSDDGRLLTTFEDVFDVARVTDCRLDSQNRLLIGLTVGSEQPLTRDLALLRLNADGQFDQSLAGLGKVRLPVDLGGPGIGLDYLVALSLDQDRVTLFGMSYPENILGGPDGTRLNLVQTSSEVLLRDGFE